MIIAARFVSIVVLSAIRGARAAPTFGTDYYISNTSATYFAFHPSLTSFQVALGPDTLNLTDSNDSTTASTVLAITLPVPPVLLDPPVIPQTSVVHDTITVTETPVASTVTVPLFIPPETITDTVVVTLSPTYISTPTSSSPSSITLVPLPSSTFASTSASSQVFSSSSASSHSSIPAPSSSAHLPSLAGLAVWTSPKHLKDLDAFNVTAFPGGKKNLQFITGIPSKASTSSKRISAAQAIIDTVSIDDYGRTTPTAKLQSLDPLTTWDDNSTSLQLLYPANSINPAQKPQGGAEFYASPLDISTARNVSLRFSVYFPPDFDWVLAGKLPGIYGGHTGCSGGNKALDCFSTRLMWRQNGVGELYLYAAKDKQTKALCSDPRSVCDAAYGFSIGRGSFTWAAGAWTTVTQTVVLNTPGKQDGAFALEVNGKKVIEKSEVFYRDVLWPAGKGTTSATGRKGKTTTGVGKGGTPMTTGKKGTVVSATTRPAPTTTAGDDPLGDILRPLLSEIGHLIRRGGDRTSTIAATTTSNSPSSTFMGVHPEAMSNPTLVHRPASPTVRRGTLAGRVDRFLYDNDTKSDDEDGPGGPENDVDDTNDPDPFTVQSNPQREGNSIGFIGIFFSTFFGGHDDKYATPKDQYVWFKDFAMSYNG